MQTLHGIDRRHSEALDAHLRSVLRDPGPVYPGRALEQYQREILQRVYVPQRTEWIGWDVTDPLRQAPTFQYLDIDTAAVVGRLDRYIARFRAEGIDLTRVGLAVSHAEARALAYVGTLAEGAELRYHGVRLFVDG